MKRACLAVSMTLATSAVASEFRLSWPVDCQLGQDCHIQQYVDHDPSSGVQDFMCSGLSYDGHKGTDVALPTLAALEPGVAVLAAADGIVRGIRDGMVDQLYTKDTAETVEGRECGNGVVMDHGDGWVTQYCHLKQGSVRVRKGQRLTAGHPIGDVGLSGQTQFPHLHLSVRKDKKVIDPFRPDPETNCGSDQADLWDSAIAYQPGGLITAGFSTAIPTLASIRGGHADEAPLEVDAAALVFWASAYGSQIGDVLTLHIQGPDTVLLDNAITLTKAQAQLFRAGGKKRRTETWPAGDYVGTAHLVRDGNVISTQIRSMTIAAP